MAGAGAILVEQYDEEKTPPFLAAHGVTLAAGGTPLVMRYLQYQRRHPEARVFPRLRAAMGGAAPKPPLLHGEVKAELGGAGVVSVYGLTEAPFVVALVAARSATTRSRAARGAPRAAPSCGSSMPRAASARRATRARSACAARRSAAAIWTARSTPTRSTREGFFRTGDLGSLDARGFLRVTGRQKEIIIRNGENISAKEIEDLLYTHPKIADAAVIGLPDPTHGRALLRGGGARAGRGARPRRDRAPLREPPGSRARSSPSSSSSWRCCRATRAARCRSTSCGGAWPDGDAALVLVPARPARRRVRPARRAARLCADLALRLAAALSRRVDDARADRATRRAGSGSAPACSCRACATSRRRPPRSRRSRRRRPGASRSRSAPASRAGACSASRRSRGSAWRSTRARCARCCAARSRSSTARRCACCIPTASRPRARSRCRSSSRRTARAGSRWRARTATACSRSRDPPPGFAWCALARSGTLLEPGETLASPRVFEALAPAIALIYHATYESAGAAVDQLPGGRAWREAIERVPAERRHLALHEGHCVAVPARERALLDPSVGAMTFTGTLDELRAALVRARGRGRHRARLRAGRPRHPARAARDGARRRTRIAAPSDTTRDESGLRARRAAARPHPELRRPQHPRDRGGRHQAGDAASPTPSSASCSAPRSPRSSRSRGSRSRGSRTSPRGAT